MGGELMRPDPRGMNARAPVICAIGYRPGRTIADHRLMKSTPATITTGITRKHETPFNIERLGNVLGIAESPPALQNDRRGTQTVGDHPDVEESMREYLIRVRNGDRRTREIQQ